jgi:hypothetical protein
MVPVSLFGVEQNPETLVARAERHARKHNLWLPGFQNYAWPEPPQWGDVLCWLEQYDIDTWDLWDDDAVQELRHFGNDMAITFLREMPLVSEFELTFQSTITFDAFASFRCPRDKVGEYVLDLQHSRCWVLVNITERTVGQGRQV